MRDVLKSIIVPIVPFDKGIMEVSWKCIKLIGEHTPPPFEIIVVFNGGDHSKFTVPMVYPELQKNIIFPEMQGNGGAWNAGYKASDGKVIVFMDNDIYVTSGWLDPILDSLSNPSVGLAIPDVWKKMGDYWGSMDDNLQGCCMATRVDVLHNLGEGDERAGVEPNLPFDPLFNPAFFEDYDLFWRVHLLGYDRVTMKESRVYHWNQLTTANVIDTRKIHRQSEEKYVKKHSGRPRYAPGEGKKC